MATLPFRLRPVSYVPPLTYGADLLHAAVSRIGKLPIWLDFVLLTLFRAGPFAVSLRNVRRKWIT